MIAAVVLAAGMSTRMGTPKMTLPWGSTTVIGQVVRTLTRGGAEEIVVVTGGARRAVERALEGLPVKTVFNPRYQEDQMALSLKTGLRSLPEEVQAALVALGDQPQIEWDVVQSVITAFRKTGAALVVPSYQMRRGHPWLVARSLWPTVFHLAPGQTLRDVLNSHPDAIHYLPVSTASVLRDLDTPDDYRRERPA